MNGLLADVGNPFVSRRNVTLPPTTSWRLHNLDPGDCFARRDRVGSPRIHGSLNLDLDFPALGWGA
eukprot:16438735-Heterocapsa_arctica.AAC.1